MSRFGTSSLLISVLLLVGCSREPKHESRLYSAGEKAEVGGLSYSVIDSQIYQQLGEDPANPRMPQNRFITVQVSILNAGGEEAPIPGMTLVDDSGQTYNELPDGTGVHNWLGMSRRVSPTQTETGMILFDAPAKHYRLRLTDEFEPVEVAIDIPLSFIHERINSATPSVTDEPAAAPRN
jgi:hypothetical protein